MLLGPSSEPVRRTAVIVAFTAEKHKCVRQRSFSDTLAVVMTATYRTRAGQYTVAYLKGYLNISMPFAVVKGR